MLVTDKIKNLSNKESEILYALSDYISEDANNIYEFKYYQKYTIKDSIYYDLKTDDFLKLEIANIRKALSEINKNYFHFFGDFIERYNSLSLDVKIIDNIGDSDCEYLNHCLKVSSLKKELISSTLLIYFQDFFNSFVHKNETFELDISEGDIYKWLNSEDLNISEYKEFIEDLAILQYYVYLIFRQSPVMSESSNNLESIVEDHLSFLKERNEKNQLTILEEKEYETLFKYTIRFLETNEVPKKLKPIRIVRLPIEDLIYTFRELYRKVKTNEGSKLPYVFFDFLHQVFAQLHYKGFDSSTYKKSPLYKKGARPTKSYPGPRK